MLEQKNQITFNISTVAIIKVIIILLLLGFLYLIRDILAILFVAVILASVIDPIADWAGQKKIPRGITTLVIYLLLFSLFSLVIALIIPPVAEQINQLSVNFGYYWNKLVSGFSALQDYSASYGVSENIQQGIESIKFGLGKTAGGAFSTLGNVFGGIISLVLTLVIAFYIIVEEDAIKRLFRSAAPAGYQPYLVRLFSRMQEKIGLWVKGQLILSFIIFIFSFVGLSILGVNYALVLALMAGLFEFVPYIGPIFAAIPAVFLAFTQSPLKALLVIILYVIIQQLENNVIVPKVMQKAVGINPIVSIIAILIGAKLVGVVGALLAIPVATALGVFIGDLFSGEAKEKTSQQ